MRKSRLEQSGFFFSRFDKPVDVIHHFIMKNQEMFHYLKLYAKATQEHWRKFRTAQLIEPQPRSGTQWDRYAQQLADPKKWLVFPNRVNTLSQDHSEWRMLRYVFELASAMLSEPSTPRQIRQQYERVIRELDQKTKAISPQHADYIPLHTADPHVIKQVKEKANDLLSRKVTACTAWRINVEEVFERFVQYLFAQAAKSLALPCELQANQKLPRDGFAPAWCLNYLETDLSLFFEKALVIVDAKYKSNMYAYAVDSKILKETHRHDLHQVLAYCSFAPQPNKLAILCYPASEQRKVRFSYRLPLSAPMAAENTILMLGLPFDADRAAETTTWLAEILKEYLSGLYQSEEQNAQEVAT